MPYGNITSNSIVYTPRTDGVYAKSTLVFGDPSDEFRIKGAIKGKDGIFRGTIMRVFQKDVTISGTVSRKQALISLSLTVPVGFTVTELDDRIADISTFCTTDTLSRFLSGES